MGRIGAKDELIEPLLLLASEVGSFMTGSDIRVDDEFMHLDRLQASSDRYKYRRIHFNLTSYGSSLKNHNRAVPAAATLPRIQKGKPM